MSKKCARCDKTVYPTEELKCLDKVWHKICFKCKECGMSLNMRNYKGFNKEPYCDAHIPKAKATTMAETPELRRIAENTKLQSNVRYHEDFEKSKGKFTQVADDPETLRIKQNTKIISNVAYHGELQRKAEMEQRRGMNENGYKETATVTTVDKINANVNSNQMQQQMAQQQQHQQMQQQQQQQMHQVQQQMAQQQQQHQQQQMHQHHNQQQQSTQQQQQQQQQHQPPPPQHHQHLAAVKTSDFVSPYSSRTSQTLIYTSDQGAVTDQPHRRIGSVHDIDPLNHNYGSLARVYKAMYDYEAQDDDEVSFLENDLIVNVSSIDGGWMTGEVQRTGQVGMLPANYVQLANNNI